MYRRETKEKAAYAGNRTRRTDSVKQHEMAALREMEQMVLAAENSEGTAGLEKAVAHLESFLQQVRKTRILDEKQRAMEAFRGKFEDGYTWRNGFLPERGTVWRQTGAGGSGKRQSLELYPAECRGEPFCPRTASCRTAERRCGHGTAPQLPGVCVRLSGVPQDRHGVLSGELPALCQGDR